MVKIIETNSQSCYFNQFLHFSGRYIWIQQLDNFKPIFSKVLLQTLIQLTMRKYIKLFQYQNSFKVSFIRSGCEMSNTTACGVNNQWHEDIQEKKQI